jgi:drug/metabolite transporter (DMT)-like permease
LTLGGVYLVARSATGSSSVEPMSWSGLLMAVVAALGWTCSTLALRPALDLVDVPTASAIRMPLVSVLLWAAALRGRVMPSRAAFDSRSLLAIGATGIVTVLATLFYLQSVALAGAGRAAVLTATSPLFAVPFSVAFLGERGGWQLVVGAVCSVAGVILLTLG